MWIMARKYCKAITSSLVWNLDDAEISIEKQHNKMIFITLKNLNDCMMVFVFPRITLYFWYYLENEWVVDTVADHEIIFGVQYNTRVKTVINEWR